MLRLIPIRNYGAAHAHGDAHGDGSGDGGGRRFGDTQYMIEPAHTPLFHALWGH